MAKCLLWFFLERFHGLSVINSRGNFSILFLSKCPILYYLTICDGRTCYHEIYLGVWWVSLPGERLNAWTYWWSHHTLEMVLVLVSCNLSRSRNVRDLTLLDRDLIQESQSWSQMHWYEILFKVPLEIWLDIPLKTPLKFFIIIL